MGRFRETSKEQCEDLRGNRGEPLSGLDPKEYEEKWLEPGEGI